MIPYRHFILNIHFMYPFNPQRLVMHYNLPYQFSNWCYIPCSTALDILSVKGPAHWWVAHIFWALLTSSRSLGQLMLGLGFFVLEEKKRNRERVWERKGLLVFLDSETKFQLARDPTVGSFWNFHSCFTTHSTTSWPFRSSIGVLDRLLSQLA